MRESTGGEGWTRVKEARRRVYARTDRSFRSPRELARKDGLPGVCGAYERRRDRNDSGESGRLSVKYISPRDSGGGPHE